MGDRFVEGRRFNRTRLCGAISVIVLGMSGFAQGNPPDDAQSGDDREARQDGLLNRLGEPLIRLGDAIFRQGKISADIGDLEGRSAANDRHIAELDRQIERVRQAGEEGYEAVLARLHTNRRNLQDIKSSFEDDIHEKMHELAGVEEDKTRWLQSIDGQIPGAATVNLLGAHIGHSESRQRARISAEIARYEQDLRQLRETYEHAQTRHAEQQALIQELEGRRVNLSDQVVDLQRYITELRTAQGEITREIDIDKRARDQLTTELEALTTASGLNPDNFRGYVDSIMTQQCYDEEIAKVRREADHWQRVSDQNLQDIHTLKDELAVARNQLDAIADERDQALCAAREAAERAQEYADRHHRSYGDFPLIPIDPSRPRHGAAPNELSSLVAASIKSSVDITRESDSRVMSRLTSPDEQGAFSVASGKATGDSSDSMGFWGSYLHRDGSQDSDSGDFLKYSIKVNGIVLGVDGNINDQFKAGFALTYAKADAKPNNFNAGSQSVKGDHYIGTFYGGWSEGPWFANALLSYAEGNNDYKLMSNSFHEPVKGKEFKGSGDTSAWSITIGGGYNMPVNKEWVFQPQAQFNYMNLGVDKYKLKYSNTTLEFDAKTFRVAELGVGFGMMGNFPMDSGVLKPELKLMGFYDFENKKYDYDFTGSDCTQKYSLIVNGRKRDQARGIAGVGLNYSVDESISLGLGCDYNYSKHYKAHVLKGMASYYF